MVKPCQTTVLFDRKTPDFYLLLHVFVAEKNEAWMEEAAGAQCQPQLRSFPGVSYWGKICA